MTYLKAALLVDMVPEDRADVVLWAAGRCTTAFCAVRIFGVAVGAASGAWLLEGAALVAAAGVELASDGEPQAASANVAAIAKAHVPAVVRIEWVVMRAMTS